MPDRIIWDICGNRTPYDAFWVSFSFLSLHSKLKNCEKWGSQEWLTYAAQDERESLFVVRLHPAFVTPLGDRSQIKMYVFCPVLLHLTSASALASNLSVTWKWKRVAVAGCKLAVMFRKQKLILRIHFIERRINFGYR